MPVALSPTERDEVGELLGARWAMSGHGVGAKALVDSVGAAGADLVELLVAVAGPLRDRPAERASEAADAEAERSAAVRALVGAGVPAAAADAWVGGRSSPRAGTGRLAGMGPRRGGGVAAAAVRPRTGPARGTR